MQVEPFRLRSKLLPGLISRPELARVSQPAVKKAIMDEFLGHFASRDAKVRLQAGQLTAENMGTYCLVSTSFMAQLPMILAMSWQPLPVVLARIPVVAQAMNKDNRRRRGRSIKKTAPSSRASRSFNSAPTTRPSSPTPTGSSPSTAACSRSSTAWRRAASSPCSTPSRRTSRRGAVWPTGRR
jgi:hypothetical protein